MTTDFNYGNKTVNSSGPIKPSGKDMPGDPRTRVNTFADIANIPVPYVGMIITVLQDETNNGKMTDYKVKSLKADSLGSANSVIDQVQRYVDYLGAGSVSQDDINTAVNNYLQDNPITGLTPEQENKILEIDNKVDKITGKGLSTNDFTNALKAKLEGLNGNSLETTELDFTNDNVVNTIHADVDETEVKQEYLGGYIEIQPDQWDGSTPSYDATSNTWGFPMSLTESEQKRIRKLILHGNTTNIRYIRFPLGFAYRGYRNIDETSSLAKNIGERFKGQNQALKRWFKDIAEVGGGLAPEYWCPAPYWVTSGGYYAGQSSITQQNFITAGGSYDRSTKLSSIKDSDPVQYNAQIEAFTDAIVDDLEYLHTNICPVRMFGLQNEPVYSNMRYGACAYESQTYNDVLEVLYPKIQASEILSYYGDEKNEVKLLVASDDDLLPFEGVGGKFITNHPELIWGYAHHLMRRESGEHNQYGATGADWFKTENFRTIKGNRKNVFCNEYEYFGDGYEENFRCSNNMLRLIFEAVYGEAKVLHPIIHICKPIGQTMSATNTKGYCMFAVNLKGEYGQEISASKNEYGLAKGTCIPNTWVYNSWAMFGDNLPVGSYVVGHYTKKADGLGWVVFKHSGKYYIFMANNTENDGSVTLDFYSDLNFEGKIYNMNYCGQKLKSKSGSSIEFVIPAYSGVVWIEKDSHTLITPPEFIPVNNATDGVCYYLANNNIDATTGEYVEGKTDRVSTQNIVVSGETCKIKINYQLGVRYYDKDQSYIYGVSLNSNSSEQTLDIPEGTRYIRLVIVAPNSTINNKTLLVDGVSYTLNPIEQQAVLQSINAVYTQGSTVIYPDTALDSLKSGLVVTALYDDSTSKTISGYSLSGTLSVGTSTITVTYQGKTATFDVNVTARPTLQSITATYTQGGTVIYPDTALDSLKDNLTVTGNYSDGSTESITNYTLSGTLTEGQSTITVNYNGLTTTFIVNVSQQAILQSITATYTQGSTVIYPDTQLNSLKNNLVVKANYSDSTSITVSDYELSGTLSVGTSTITVTYQGKTATFDVTVTESSKDNSYVEGYINDDGVIQSLASTYTTKAYVPVNSKLVTINTAIPLSAARIAQYDENKTFVTRQAKTNLNGGTEAEFTIDSETKYIRISFTVNDANIKENELNTLFNEYTIHREMVELLYEQGGIASSGGATTTETDRYRTIEYVPCSSKTNIVAYGLTYIVREYDDSNNYLGSTSTAFASGGSYLFKNNSTTKIKFVMKTTESSLDGSVIKVGAIYYVLREKQ